MAKMIRGDCLEVMAGMEECSVDSIVTDPPYGLKFMGKNWDHGIPGVEFWVQALKVAKPGAYLLAFGGTRTFHRLMVAIEDAGWEIRDTIMWVYGSGFPKSHNISKAIDKEAGAVREVIGFDKSKWRDSKKHTSNTIGNNFDYYNTKAKITVPSTHLSKQWDGWGTALKPAFEPVIVARKPFKGTVADNVAKWGTGAMNIDGCRVGTDGEDLTRPFGHSGDYTQQFKNIPRGTVNKQNDGGRWPANLIHDGSDEVVGLFPQTNPSKEANRGAGINGNTFFSPKYEGTIRGHADNGGSAARFFYSSKASKKDRDEGLDGFEELVAGGLSGRSDGSLGTVTYSRNIHPTVKPTNLMRYLCRLVTQPGGTVLDPFAGSGSTGKAAVLEGFEFIGIEQNEEYCKIAEARIKHAKEQGRLL